MSNGKFIVVAEGDLRVSSDHLRKLKEADLKLDKDKTFKLTGIFCTKIGGLTWQCLAEMDKDLSMLGTNAVWGSSLTLACPDARQTLDGFYVNIVFYKRSSNTEPYEKQKEETIRHQKLVSGYCLKIIQGESKYDVRIFIRILKDRSTFTDFTAQNCIFGHLKSNIQLQVGEQIFHANKQLLSTLSPVFDRMFNGDFPDGHQEKIEFKGIPAEVPHIFHDFLLMIANRSGSVLPNSKNVAQLMALAKYFQVEWVMDVCLEHLRLNWEMPKTDRVRLVTQYDSGDAILLSILNEASYV